MKPASVKVLLWWIVICMIGGIVFIFPPFRIVPLDKARAKSQAQAFNAGRFAAQFWQSQLTGSLNTAFEAREVLEAIRRDRQSAKNRYGRIVGLGGPHHYFLKGTGRIIALREREAEINLDADNNSSPDIILMTSMIFGNEVLNATGLVNPSQFQRTNDYNAISAQVNRIVETQVVPPFLEKAKIGDTVRFIGCSVKVSDDDPVPIPMRLVPVKLEIE